MEEPAETRRRGEDRLEAAAMVVDRAVVVEVVDRPEEEEGLMAEELTMELEGLLNEMGSLRLRVGRRTCASSDPVGASFGR